MTTPTYGMFDHAKATPDKTALVLGDTTLTYAELDRRATQLVHALRQRGVTPGERVAVMLPNSFEFFEAGAATARAQASIIPVNWHLKSEELAWILQDSRARVLVAHASLGDHVDRAVADTPDCHVLLVEGDGETSYEAALAAAGDDPEPIEGWSTLSYVFYTSGTTGRPKGVVHADLDPERMQLSTLGLVHLWGFRPDDVHILSGPAYHAGPGGYAFTTLFAGGAVVILPTWDAVEWLRLVDRHRVTNSFMTPAHFIRILEVPDEERKQYDLSSLRFIIHAGAPCPIPVKERIMDALAPAEIWELYGMSEGGATRISPDEWRQRPGSVGTPWPGVQVKILDETGAELPPGETGLIYVVPAGGARFHYHDDPEKTAQAWREDAFTVGDVGHLDHDGYLYVTDRASDMVLRGGVNVYPREIEDVLHRHRTVVDCAVFGVPDERLGERLKAVVEVRGPVTAGELQDHCRRHLADFKCPEVVELVDTLPRDPNGKVMKRFLRDEARKAM